MYESLHKFVEVRKYTKEIKFITVVKIKENMRIFGNCFKFKEEQEQRYL